MLAVYLEPHKRRAPTVSRTSPPRRGAGISAAGPLYLARMTGSGGRPEFAQRTLALVPYIVGGVQVSDNDAGMAQIKLPRSRSRLFRILSFLFRLPEDKILVLDETGTMALGLINGQRTFSELAGMLAAERGIDNSSAQHSMAAFLTSLADRRVVAFRKAAED